MEVKKEWSAALWDPPRTQLINSMPSPRISNVTINTSQNFQMLHPSRAGNAITDINRGLHIADEICKKREEEEKEEEKDKEEEDVLDASCVPLAKFSHPFVHLGSPHKMEHILHEGLLAKPDIVVM